MSGSCLLIKKTKKSKIYQNHPSPFFLPHLRARASQQHLKQNKVICIQYIQKLKRSEWGPKSTLTAPCYFIHDLNTTNVDITV
jgi:hypothetical protein